MHWTSRALKDWTIEGYCTTTDDLLKRHRYGPNLQLIHWFIWRLQDIFAKFNFCYLLIFFKQTVVDVLNNPLTNHHPNKFNKNKPATPTILKLIKIILITLSLYISDCVVNLCNTDKHSAFFSPKQRAPWSLRNQCLIKTWLLERRSPNILHQNHYISHTEQNHIQLSVHIYL